MTETADTIETFDDSFGQEMPQNASMRDSIGDWGEISKPINREKESEQKKEPAKKEIKTKSDKGTDFLETKEESAGEAKKEEKEKKGDSKEEKKESKDEAKKEEVGKDLDKEDTKETKESKRKIRALDGEDAYDLNPDMRIKMKADGKYIEPTLAELRDAYASSTHQAERLSKVKAIEQEVQIKESKIKEQEEAINQVFSKVDALFKDEKAKPLDAVNYFLDLFGYNRHDFYVRLMESQLEELETLQGMSEDARRAFFLDKENQYLKSRDQESAQRKQTADQESAYIKHVDDLRTKSNISEEQFMAALSDMKDDGHNMDNVTAEQVIEYAKLTPLYDKSHEILRLVDPDLLENYQLLEEVVGVLKLYPSMTVEKAADALRRELGYPSEVKVLQKKAMAKNPLREEETKQIFDRVETFDDYDL